MPWHDPQFLVVTVVALWGLYAATRDLRPRGNDAPACGSCDSCQGDEEMAQLVPLGSLRRSGSTRDAPR